MSDIPTIRREDLAQFFSGNPRLLRAFEQQAAAVQDATSGVADTQALKDATVIVLSANGDFTNERVLEVGDGIEIDITDDRVKLSVKDVAKVRDHDVTLIPPATVILFLPPEGTLVSDVSLIEAPLFVDLGNYANDAAAAAGGVTIGSLYHNAGALRVRLT
jgi:hypothetical protein